jgi:hypothetical protein
VRRHARAGLKADRYQARVLVGKRLHHAQALAQAFDEQ